MRLLMFDEVRGVRASEIADVASVRFFACMSTAVNSCTYLLAAEQFMD